MQIMLAFAKITNWGVQYDALTFMHNIEHPNYERFD